VRRDDAARSEAVLTPLIAAGNGGRLCEDRSQPPLLAPLTLLGCMVEVEERSPGDAYVGATYTIIRTEPSCGGPALKTLVLDDSTFAASAMKVGGEVPFAEMKLPQLREELAARGSSRSGLKPSLQRRLHGLLVQAAIARRSEEAAEEDGTTTSDCGQGGSGGTESAPPAKRVCARPAVP
jgi:hypothetical protein